MLPEDPCDGADDCNRRSYSTRYKTRSSSRNTQQAPDLPCFLHHNGEGFRCPGNCCIEMSGRVFAELSCLVKHQDVLVLGALCGVRCYGPAVGKLIVIAPVESLQFIFLCHEVMQPCRAFDLVV